jgi:hypothetical protein
MSSPEQFEDTKQTVKIAGEERPVLKLGKRLFAGTTLSLVNPHGFGGDVWSAMDMDTLKYNANLRRHDGSGH